MSKTVDFILYDIFCRYKNYLVILKVSMILYNVYLLNDDV